MSSNTCFFMGHHDAPERIYPTLLAVVERHVAEYGVAEFIVGRYGSFDRMATRAVKGRQRELPHREVDPSAALPSFHLQAGTGQRL